MHNPEFTIGMLVAFQMFSSRLSGPVLRLVGMWQDNQDRLSSRRADSFTVRRMINHAI